MAEKVPEAEIRGEPVTEAPEANAEEPVQPKSGAEAAEPQKTQEPAKPILADRFAAAGTLGEKICINKTG
ncbi:MAG: hypothetical protein MZV63_68685 [Marinilabiliales bacterium]|nr:hypothetical protein [Marinilabiliales bacterium]